MTLLFLTPRPSSSLGGLERHVRLLTRELERRGHRVKELTLHEIEKGDRDRDRDRDLSAEKNRARTVLSIPKGLSFKYQAWKSLWNQRRVIERADVVHVHDVFWWYLPFRFLHPNKPVFTTFHGWEGVCPPTKSAIFQKKVAQRLSWGTIGVGTFFEKWYGVKPTMTTFGALEPEVREIGKRVKMREGVKVRMPEGVRVKKPDEIRTVAFFGRLEPVNGIDIAFPALIKLQAVKYQILYIGDGSWRSKAEKVGQVTGIVKNPWRHIVESDLVVTSSYLCMLETAALSRPIIALTTNPLKHDYLLAHPFSQFISIVSSVESLLERIQNFDIAQHRDKVRAAQRWSLEQTPQKLADLYEKLWKVVPKSNVSRH